MVWLLIFIALRIIRCGEFMGDLALGAEAGYLLAGKVIPLSEMMV